MHGLASLVFLLLSVGSLVGCYFALGQDVFLDVKKEEDCEKKANSSTQICTFWTDNFCWKGTGTQSSCTFKSDIIPLVLLCAGGGFLLLAIICLFWPSSSAAGSFSEGEGGRIDLVLK